MQLNNQSVNPEVFNKMSDEYLGDLRNNYSNMNLVGSGSQDKVQINFMKNKLKIVPTNITYNNIYGNPEDQEYNIAYSLL